MKAIHLHFGKEIEKAEDAKEAVVSSLTAYIRFCPNLHTVKLDIPGDTPWVFRQLPGVLSGLVSLCRIAFRFWTREDAEVILVGDNEKPRTTLDEDLGDGAKFRRLEYVEVLCVSGGFGDRVVPHWWENDPRSSEDEESDIGRGSNGEDGETERREECHSPAIESRRAEEGKQQGMPSGVELGSNTGGHLPYDLLCTMDLVADFHRRQKPLTDIFPRLSARGVLWCAINHELRAAFPLRITASNLLGMKSRNWRPRYCESLFDQALDYH
ncbi:hypothetical protein NLI96_g8591 [Meripilus lineatus]|uniref:Uncharacterized protein n=1 Tax=Meripilus lineatus TaxID=2056292 RepID=A0AAD5YDU3_9APHY|nr:hypothetical protein NLI96_g8591 [Physisporinus lineatus]